MRLGKADINQLEGNDYENLVNNDALNSFRIAILNSVSLQKMVDGLVDEFEDETGVDIAKNINALYNSTDDYYSMSEGDTTTIDTMEYSTDTLALSAYTPDYSTTKALLHFQGENGATTTSDSSIYAKAITFYGTAQISTAQYKFGTSSLLLDGDSDYISIADSDDWYFNSGNFTLEGFFYFNSTSGTRPLFNQGSAYTGNALRIIYGGDGKLYLGLVSGGSWLIDSNFSWTPSTSTWYHIALSRENNSWRMFVDGTQVGSTLSNSSAIPNFSSAMEVGHAWDGAGNQKYFSGYVADIKISKGISLYNANFTAPSVTLTSDLDLIPTSESSIKQQGSYSLKLTANTISTLNHRVRHTFASPIDISNRDNLKGYLRSDRTGANIRAMFYNNPDAYTKLLIHGIGYDGQIDFKDFSVDNNTITTNGNAQVDTAQYKFLSSSLLLDGTGDYLSVADSASWDITTGDYTIEAFVRFNALPTSGNKMTIASQYASATSYWDFSILNTSGTYSLQFLFYNGSARTVTVNSTGLSTNTWYHIAVSKSGNDYSFYQDGVLQGTVQTNTNSVSAVTGALQIGAYNGGSAFNGWLAEIRISQGIARYPIAFTPTTAPFNLYTSTCTIAESGVFELMNCDISAEPTENLNAIKYLDFEIINADSTTIFYIDDVYASANATGITLVSNSVEAVNQPTDGRIVILYEEVNAMTLNTDIKAWISTDDNANYNQITLEEVGYFDSTKRILVGNSPLIDRSDKTMRWKITTHNSKDAKLHGVGFFWRP